MRNFKLVLSVTLSLLLLFSCKEGGRNKTFYMPSVSGKAGEVLIVIDKNYWESDLGSVLRTTLAADYLYLPQREPMFTIYNTTPNSFRDYGSYVSHRNIILFNIGDSFKSSKVAYQENIWAAPQFVITVSAPTKDDALNTFIQEKEKIISSIEQAERNRIITNSRKYQEISLRDLVMAEVGGSPYFPQGYSLKKKTSDFIWISYETTYVNQGILIYKYPYDRQDLTLDKIVAKRNEFLKANVPGMREGSYMTTSSLIQPGFKWIQYKDQTFAEVRGLWELEGDYMGGPFVCHTFTDKNNENVIVLEGFVYAPKFDKRNYLRHVESILYSFEWDK